MDEKKKLGEMLIEAGLIDNLQLDSALGHQRNWGGKLGSIFVELGFITESELAGFIEKQLHFPCVRISSLDIPGDAIDSVKVEVAKKYKVFPIKIEGNTITTTMMDPTDLRLIDELQFMTGKRIKPVLALESEIKRAIRKYYDGEDVEGKQYRVEPKVRTVEEPPLMKTDERLLDEKEFVASEEPKRVEKEVEPQEKKDKKEIPSRVIVEALSSLLIEKGIIERDELLERIKKQLRK